MSTKHKSIPNATFKREVHEGLTAFPKYLSSKYFYDKKGDKLFQQIMELPEYYLTGCEYEIIDTYKDQLAQLFKASTSFDLIELGAGDGKKTKVLLQYLLKKNIAFNYKPIDISPDVLDELETAVKKTWPEINIETKQGTYFEVLDRIAQYNERKKVIMVLGSNIGNLTHKKAVEFLKNIRESMAENDLLFMGFDQKKSPEQILAAYKDEQGITEAFNKNLLIRINRELDADFDPDQFLHWPTYNPETGTTKSFLVSKIKQQVQLNSLDLTVDFEAWESIHTEISQKYDDAIVTWLAKEAGLKITDQFQDSNHYFTNYIFKKLN